MHKSDIIKEVKEALKLVKVGKVKRKELEDKWKSMELRKEEIANAVKAFQEELISINTEQPTVGQELTSLVTSLTKAEGFLETIGRNVEGELEDFIK